MKDCLSPRSANIPSKAPLATKPSATKPKEKNHASPPPKLVIQPPGFDGLPGEKYSIGKELGKGGFAICYEGVLHGQRHGAKASKFALKIVKAKMGVKKMEEKVHEPHIQGSDLMILTISIVSYRIANPLQNASSSYRRVPSGVYIRRKYLHCSRALSKRFC